MSENMAIALSRNVPESITHAGQTGNIKLDLPDTPEPTPETQPEMPPEKPEQEAREVPKDKPGSKKKPSQIIADLKIDIWAKIHTLKWPT